MDAQAAADAASTCTALARLARRCSVLAHDLGLPPRRQSGIFEVPAWPAAPPVPAAAARTSEPAAAAAGDVRIPDNLDLAEAERRYAVAVLERAGGNQSAAARQLGISRNKLARLLKP